MAPRAAEAAGYLRDAGYRPCSPEGTPSEGGSGLLTQVPVRLTIRTLNRLAPDDPPGDQQYCTKNAVWAYYGHGREPTEWSNNIMVSSLQFLDDPVGSGISDPVAGQETPDLQRYYLSNFSLGHVKVVYLAACYSGGCSAAGTRVTADKSLAQHFVDRGAKCAVGFQDKFVPKYPGFCSFNRRFWEALCEYKKSVGEAMKDATDGNWRLSLKPKVKPVLRGNRNVTL